jgi:hypothetical protein
MYMKGDGLRTCPALDHLVSGETTRPLARLLLAASGVRLDVSRR